MLHRGVLLLVLLATGPAPVAAAHIEALGSEGRRPRPKVGPETRAQAPETRERVIRLHVVTIVEK